MNNKITARRKRQWTTPIPQQSARQFRREIKRLKQEAASPFAKLVNSVSEAKQSLIKTDDGAD